MTLTAKDKVLRALELGATTRREVVAKTALDESMVNLLIDRILANHESQISIDSACATESGCNACPVSGSCAPRPGHNEPVFLTLSARPNNVAPAE